MYAVSLNQSALVFNNGTFAFDNEENTIIIHPSFESDTLDSIYKTFVNQSNKKIFYSIPFEQFPAFLHHIKSQCTVLQAAGGLVLNEVHEVLLIHRLGHWDLPKGKIEKDESVEEAAKREICEETGLTELELNNSLCTTWHLYLHKNELILKETFWFLATSKSTMELAPQYEEHIEQAVWKQQAEAENLLTHSYFNLKLVWRAYLEKQSNLQ
jgi:8-oxo-dGTP pyrophosphatase MutT (NUDIX family)